MFRTLAALLVLLVASTPLWAGDYTGKLQKIDPDRRLLTIRVDGKNVTHGFTATTRFLDERDSVLKFAAKDNRLRPGTPIRVYTDRRGDKEVIYRVKLTR
jgi:hypothetical protein